MPKLPGGGRGAEELTFWVGMCRGSIGCGEGRAAVSWLCRCRELGDMLRSEWPVAELIGLLAVNPIQQDKSA